MTVKSLQSGVFATANRVVQKDFPATVEEIRSFGTLAKVGGCPFYSKVEKRMAEEKMKKRMFGIFGSPVTEIFPEGSSRELFWQEHYVPRVR